MSHNPKTARLSTAGYRALFTPRAPQAEKKIVIISDDKEMATPTPACGIETNPMKVKAILDLGPPQALRDAQKLMGCLASLSWFISR